MPLPVQDTNLGNLCSSRPLPDNPFDHYSEHSSWGAAQMFNIPLIGVATALVACAILARVFAHRPQKAEKAQKGEISKQLLALSERESKLSGTPSSARSRAPISKEGMRPGNGPRKATPKILQPLPSKSPSPKSLTRS
jgi:hypothetical protein